MIDQSQQGGELWIVGAFEIRDDGNPRIAGNPRGPDHTCNAEMVDQQQPRGANHAFLGPTRIGPDHAVQIVEDRAALPAGAPR